MSKVVAIDGTSGSGKGTLARRVAEYFSFSSLDTGLIYRMMAYLDVQGESYRDFSLERFSTMRDTIEEAVFRSDDVSIRSSLLARDADVRNIATELQRNFVKDSLEKGRGVVLDGRDIGTTVVPDAFCKFFLTADVEIRAKRRWMDLRKVNPNVSYTNVLENLRKRDKCDQERDNSPLTFTSDYTIIDTSSESAEDVFAKVRDVVKERLSSYG